MLQTTWVGQGRKGAPFLELLLCARHMLGVLLSIIIPVSQMRKNAEKLNNLPKTYRWEVEKPAFQNKTVLLKSPSLQGAAPDFWSWFQHCHQLAVALG